MHLVRIQNITVWFQLLEVGILFKKKKKNAKHLLLCHLQLAIVPCRKNVFYFIYLFLHFGVVYCRTNWVLFDIAWYFAVLGQLAG